MKTIFLLAGLFCAYLSTTAFAATQDTDWARGLDLESAVRSSDLIVVVKVESIQEIRFMWGGKGGDSVEQYKFKPLRVLKGVFARDELSLMSSDLGGYRLGGGMRQIREGTVILLFLGRSSEGYQNANNNAGSWQQSTPMLRDENDPLTDSVKALMAMAGEHEETKCVKILLDQLAKAQDIDAIPLFMALDRLAWVAAQNPDTAKIVAKQIASPNLIVSTAAADTADFLLEQDYLKHEESGKELKAALLTVLDTHPPNVELRCALLGALGGLQGYATEIPSLAAHLDIDQPVDTFSEQSAKLEAAGKLDLATFDDKIHQYLQKLPLDAPSNLEHSCEVALFGVASTRLNPVDVILDRISKKCAAGLDSGPEIALLGTISGEEAAPALVKIAGSLPAWKYGAGQFAGQGSFMASASEEERAAFAQACLGIAGKLPSKADVAPGTDAKLRADIERGAAANAALNESLVVLLTPFLDPDERSRDTAIEALLKIDTDSAAKALQPHLTGEQNLYSKLHVAEFLGKHGIQDGYPYAMEHMSDGWLLEQAVAALAAIKDPKTVPQLKQILATSNDVAWNRAAVRALGAMDVKDEADKFLEITADWKNPLAASALIALGDLGEIKALPKVREAFTSRKDEIVIAGTRAAAKLLAAHPDTKADDVRDQLVALAASGDADPGVRQAALDALVALKDTRLDKALAAMANDAGFNHSEAFLQLLKDHKIVLNQ